MRVIGCSYQVEGSAMINLHKIRTLCFKTGESGFFGFRASVTGFTGFTGINIYPHVFANNFACFLARTSDMYLFIM